MNASHDLPVGKRLIDAFTMLIVASMSMVLLIYVAFGEARRNYERFQIEKLIAQGQVVQSSLESFVRPGLPAHQYVGFNNLAEPMVKADPLIDAISFFNANGDRTFQAGHGHNQIFPACPRPSRSMTRRLRSAIRAMRSRSCFRSETASSRSAMWF